MNSESEHEASCFYLVASPAINSVSGRRRHTYNIYIRHLIDPHAESV